MNFKNLEIVAGIVMALWLFFIFINHIYKKRLCKENKRDLKALVVSLDKLIRKISLKELNGEEIALAMKNHIEKIQKHIVHLDELINMPDKSDYVEYHLEQLSEEMLDIDIQLSGAIILETESMQIIRIN
jgi:hypothetical protein